VTQMLIKVFV